MPFREPWFEGLPLLLPVIVFFSASWALRTRAHSWPSALRWAGITVSLLSWFLSESLPLLHALHRGGLVATWGVIALAAMAAAARSEVRPPVWKGGPLGWAAAGAALLVLPVLLLNFLCPPNNWDSLAYHLPRVAQWWSRGSVGYFPTNNLYQLIHPSLSEYLVLQIYGLGLSDRFLTLAQFFAWLGIPVLYLCLLEERPRSFSGNAAALLAWSLPGGLLQASTAKNDLVLSFFALNLFLAGQRFRLAKGGWAELGLALGLFLGVKGTAYLLCGPILLFSLWRAPRWRLLPLPLALALALLMNAPYYARGFATFGTPLPSGGEQFLVSDLTLAGAAGNLAKNLALELNLPSERWARLVTSGLEKIHSALGVAPGDPRYTSEQSGFSFQPLYWYEDYDGNTLFFLLLLLALVTGWSHSPWRRALGAFAGGFLLLAIGLRWKSWNARLLLPLFFLAVPFVAAELSRWRKRLAAAALVMCVAGALPYLLWNPLKPLLAHAGRPTVFELPRPLLYFAAHPASFALYRAQLPAIAQKNCAVIALASNNDALEFPLWIALGAPRRKLSVQQQGVGNESGRIVELGPRPCASFSLQTR